MARKKTAKKTEREPKCSLAKGARIMAAVAEGYTQKEACAREKIHPRTFRRWRDGSEGRVRDYARAEGEALQVYKDEYRECMLVVLGFVRDEELDPETRMRAAERAVKMLQFILSVLDRATYGKSQRVELTGKDGEKLEGRADVDMEVLRQVAQWQAEFSKKESEDAADGAE